MRLHVPGAARADVIEEGDRAAFAAFEEEMKKVGMAFLPPTTRGNRVNERQSHHITIEAHGFRELPGGPGCVMNAGQSWSCDRRFEFSCRGVEVGFVHCAALVELRELFPVKPFGDGSPSLNLPIRLFWQQRL